MIKPTIGRVVWFWVSAEEAERDGAQARAALVTFVHDDYCVNLAVFDKEGDHIPHQAVELWQGIDQGERPKSLHCEWMPYQKGQAAKHEVDIPALALKVQQLEAMLRSYRSGVDQAAKAVVPPQSNAAVPSPAVTTANTTAPTQPGSDLLKGK